MRRSPGRTISSDGTFRLMSRTTGSAQVLVLLLGADHSIIAYYVLKSEKWAELCPGLVQLRSRLHRLESQARWRSGGVTDTLFILSSLLRSHSPRPKRCAMQLR